jgi:sulfatase modifying factor 1
MAVALSTVVGTVGAACSVTLDYSGIDDGVRDSGFGGDGFTLDGPTSIDGSTDASVDAHVDGSLDATSSDSSLGNDTALDSAPDGPCPSLHGPLPVPVFTGCMDSTEVTVADYTAFLAAKAGDTSGQPAECSSWNTSLVPYMWPPAGATNLPVEYANWCQAYMYCAWAGKHLCGSLDGGAVDPAAWADQTQSEWYNACTHNGDGLHAYPYGNTYEANACNGMDNGVNAEVASVSSCVGGYPGLFDLSGNLYEWENSCAEPTDGAAPGPDDYCHIRGGSFSDDANNLRCDNSTSVNRRGPSVNVGIRCCSNGN